MNDAITKPSNNRFCSGQRDLIFSLLYHMVALLDELFIKVVAPFYDIPTMKSDSGSVFSVLFLRSLLIIASEVTSDSSLDLCFPND